MAKGIIKSKTIKKGKTPTKLSNKKGFSLFSYDMGTFALLSEQISDPVKKQGLLECIAAGVVTMLILVQIRVGMPSMSSQQVDQLPSVKLYKSRILGGFLGRMMGASVGIIDSTEFVKDIETVIEQFTELPVPDCKPVSKPTKDNYPQYIYYGMSQMMGFIQSTPTTNLNFLNFKPDCVNWDLAQALSFIDPSHVAGLNKEISQRSSLTTFSLTGGEFPWNLSHLMSQPL